MTGWLHPQDEGYPFEEVEAPMTGSRVPASREAEPEDENLVEPPDPVIWEGAARCDVCGHIETHADHASAPETPEPPLDVERIR